MDNPKPKSAIEIAREAGVDIDALRYGLTLTPTERLRVLEAILIYMMEARDSLRQHGIEVELEDGMPYPDIK